MKFSTRSFVQRVAVLGFAAGLLSTLPADLQAKNFKARKAVDVTQQIDQIIQQDLAATESQVAPTASDEDFLRRVTFDLTGTLPTPNDITLFGLDPNPEKRAELIERLLQSDEYANNWARYWRDVIFSRATDQRARLMIGTFENWMADQLRDGVSWDKITSELITATGSVREEGQTALMFAHQGNAEEIAAEASRIFLGIQIQCANCHDHPTDEWKREQFHQLAAFFPRVRVRLIKDSKPRTFEVVSFNRPEGAGPGGGFGQFQQNPAKLFRQLDKNRDGILTRDEVKQRKQLSRVFGRMLKLGDKNGDKGLSAEEIKNLPLQQANNRRRSSEYYMPDLDDPTSKGTRIDPAFFVAGQKPEVGLDDEARRNMLARYVTIRDNPWFARAFVNRIWGELLGAGFTMPVDDMGPDRDIAYPEVLDALSDGFVGSGYDVRWLLRTITNSEAYQRRIRPVDPSGAGPQFAAAIPTRMRSDQLYSALTRVLGLAEGPANANRRPGGYRRPAGPRAAFALTFGYDPSTPQTDLTGTVPQALFLMNSPFVNSRVSAQGNTPLAKLLKTYSEDEDVLAELYLLVLAREPTENELTTCREYIAETGEREAAFEDIMWSLINSTEFRTKR